MHEFVRSAHSPRGNRMEQYLSGLHRDVTVDDSQILASLALADLADYISVVYDESFSLIRYAEHLAVSTADFSQAAAGLSSPVLNDFYKPLLQEKLRPFLGGRALFCISIPFPGTFEAALFTAKEIRVQFGNKAIVSFGGGYVNTELRTVKEARLFDFCDILSYDKGYGSYVDFFENDCALNGKQLYKIKYRFNGLVIEPLHHSERLEMREKSYIKKIIPDFSGIDFDLYPRLADDTNPMHRIWNDGAWLKAYMAYGCYWHRCAFCDTSLAVRIHLNDEFLALAVRIEPERDGIIGAPVDAHRFDDAGPAAFDEAVMEVEAVAAVAFLRSVRGKARADGAAGAAVRRVSTAQELVVAIVVFKRIDNVCRERDLGHVVEDAQAVDCFAIEQEVDIADRLADFCEKVAGDGGGKCTVGRLRGGIGRAGAQAHVKPDVERAEHVDGFVGDVVAQEGAAGGASGVGFDLAVVARVDFADQTAFGEGILDDGARHVCIRPLRRE